MKAFWQFTRPHTIIGSFVSVTALYLIATGEFDFSGFFIAALIAALLCNIFITGYNQLVDIELDRVNKPELPLPSGKLKVKTAKILVWGSLILSLAISAFVSLYLLALIGVIAILGFVYSWKSIYLKRHHQTAALAIILVRGVMVNLGFYAIFANTLTFPYEIWVLTSFVVLFSAGIAWFKDIPDVEGDAEVKIGSLAIVKGARRAFSAGVWLVGSAYTLAAFSPFFLAMSAGATITFGHAILGLVFLSLASRTDPLEKKSMKRFYLSFWVLFFLEYVLWVGAVLDPI